MEKKGDKGSQLITAAGAALSVLGKLAVGSGALGSLVVLSAHRLLQLGMLGGLRRSVSEMGRMAEETPSE